MIKGLYNRIVEIRENARLAKVEDEKFMRSALGTIEYQAVVLMRRLEQEKSKRGGR